MKSEVKMEKAKIWRKDIEGKNGTFHKYTASISKNVAKEGEKPDWVNAYIPVSFTKKSGAPEKIDNGALCNFEGFFSVENYTDKEGKTRTNPIIIIMKADFDAGFEEVEEPIPF